MNHQAIICSIQFGIRVFELCFFEEEGAQLFIFVDACFLQELVDALAKLLAEKSDTEIVLTGRAPSEKIAQYADYYTCMEPVKHPYSEGLCARKGIEF